MKHLNASIKGKIFLILGGLTLFLCVSYTGVALLVAYVTEDTVLENMLNQETQYLRDRHAMTGQWPTPSGRNLVLVKRLEELPSLVQSEVRHANLAGRHKAEVFSPQKEHYHVMRLTEEHAGPYLLAEVSALLAVSDLKRNLANFMIVVAMTLIAMALFVAYRLSRTLAMPIVSLSEEVKIQAKQSHVVALSAASRKDEIGFLAQTLEDSFRRLQSALERERLFTRDISHELRTPLTVLSNFVQSHAAVTLKQADQTLLRSSIQEIESVLASLLALARAENFTRQEVSLNSSMEDAILQLEKFATVQNMHYALQFDEAAFERDYRIESHPHLLQLLLNHLFVNALLHGGEEVRIRLEFSEQHILIANTIATMPSFHTSGLRHGKSVVRRVVEALGWNIEYQTADGEYVVLLRF